MHIPQLSGDAQQKGREDEYPAAFLNTFVKAYLTSWLILKIGRMIDIAMKPTMPPISTIIIGSIMLVTFLIVARNSGFARNVFPVGKVRYGARRQPAELISKISEEPRTERVPPVHSSVDPSRITSVEKPKNVRAIGARTLITKAAGKLILPADRFVEARLQRVLMHGAQDGDLKIVTRVSIQIWQRVEAQQRLGLRADAVLRNCIADERCTVARIEDLYGSAERVQSLGEVSIAFQLSGHQSGLCAGSAISRPLVADEKVRAVADQVRNSDWAAEGDGPLQVRVGGLGRVLAG